MKVYTEPNNYKTIAVQWSETTTKDKCIFESNMFLELFT